MNYIIYQVMLQTYLKEILSLKCTGLHPVGVYDKQNENHSIITSVSNSKHESTAHVTAHVKDLVLTIVAEMSRQIISQIQRLF